jgi:HlyD family secretion protein
VRAAELQVASAGRGGSAYLTAQSQLRQARSSRDTAASRLGYATIAAPRDGVLISRNVEQGAVVQAGKALLVLAPAGEAQIVLQIDERNLGKLVLGQKAIASADAYPNQRFDAVLSYINPGIDLSRAAVEVKLTIPAPPAYLRQDMTVSTDIEIARRTDALVLSVRAVRDALTESPWVLALRDGRARRVAVRIGLQGSTRFEITEGLAEGEVVIPATANAAPGDRARPMPP